MSAAVQTVLALLAAFVVATVVIPTIRGLAHRFDLIDHPDHRKRHSQPTPLTGGLGIFAGFMIGLIIVGIPITPYWSLILGSLTLLITGLVDDISEVSAAARLLIQIAVGCLMVYGGGLSVHVLGPIFGPAYGPVGLGVFAGPFTVACVVFTINAVNMSDGLDGLAGGTCLFIFGLLGLSALLSGASTELITIALLMALATLGFLVHNVRVPGQIRARAFLGDAGSMMLGYAVAWLAITIHDDARSSLYPVTMAWILLIPAMDTLALFFRRIRLGRSPFAPDRAHLHHIIRRCNYGVVTTVHLIHLLVIATGLFGILAWQYRWPEWLMFSGATFVLLGYQVFLANAHRVLRWHWRRAKARTQSS